MKVDTIVHGGVVVTMDAARRVIEDGAVAVADGRIVAVGPSVEVLSSHAGERLDAAGQAILPGLIDVHAHAGHGLVKSMGMDEPGRWEAICGEVYTTASTTGFWYAEARLAALERLRFGVTTGVSLLGGGDTIMRTDDPKYADAHCRGVAEVGTRSVVAIGPTRAPHPRAYADPDSGGAPYPVTFERQMETCARVIGDWHGRDGIDIALLYPVLRDEHERDMAPEDYAEACRQTVAVRSLSRERGLVFTQDGHWRGSVRRADALGLLGTDALLSHCIELHEDEIAALGRTHTGVAHNPSAVASILGRCPAIELMTAGATVALGSDATAPDRSADMFRHMQQAMHYHRTHFRDPKVLPAGRALAMCTIDAAQALGMADRIGSLEPGKLADLTIVDLARAHLYPPNMPVHRLIYFANGNDVRTVMVGGQILYRDRIAQNVDEDTILAGAAKESAAIVKRIDVNRELGLSADFWN